jgi:formate-dependent nitrite reductase cytochrome c552 subunit
MGRLICEKHGEQSFFETCEHHYTDIMNGVKSEVHTIEILSLKICANCYDTYCFEAIHKLNIEEVLRTSESDKVEKLLAEKYNTISRKGFCSECYLELITDNSEPN